MNIRKTKYFWTFFVLAVISVLMGLIMAPIWSNTDVFFKGWGAEIINILVGVIIILYLVFYLFKKLKVGNSFIKVLTLVEFIVMAIIALGCILAQFKVINVGGPCEILGVAIWFRGCVGAFRGYFHKTGDSNRFSMFQMALSIALVTFGTYLFASPIFQNTHIQWVIAIGLFVLAVALIVIGVNSKPTTSKRK